MPNLSDPNNWTPETSSDWLHGWLTMVKACDPARVFFEDQFPMEAGHTMADVWDGIENAQYMHWFLQVLDHPLAEEVRRIIKTHCPITLSWAKGKTKREEKDHKKACKEIRKIVPNPFSHFSQNG
jgi:hypothetical protein